MSRLRSLVSDQRMPGMTGVVLLVRAGTIYPDARRVLLTAYADTSAAIRAINTARIHYYLSKPWDPPEEKLYPVLTDLLEGLAWRVTGRPLRACASSGTAGRSRITACAASSRAITCPTGWVDVAAGPEGPRLLSERQLDPEKLPVVLLADGTALVDPELEALAGKVGLSVQAAEDFYDMIVVGAGPAGLAGAVYGASEGLKTLVIEPDAPGGQAGSSSKIENYLGFPSGVTGSDLGRRAHTQATRFGAEFLTQRATGMRIEGQYRFIQLADGGEVSSHSVLLASGVQYRKLDIPGAERLTGRGIYYGAALVEALSCKDEEVFTVGGANSAGQAALHFAKFAAKRYHAGARQKSLSATMSKYLIDEISSTSNIVVEARTQVLEALGDDRLQMLKLSGPSGENEVSASSLFVFIGAAPVTAWLPDCILRDEKGFLLAGPDLRVDGRWPNDWRESREPFLLESSVPGVFVAGDVRHGSVKRVASAVGEGSIAVQFVHQYLGGF